MFNVSSVITCIFFLLRRLKKINANSLFLFDFTSLKGCLKQTPTFQFLAGGQWCAEATGSQLWELQSSLEGLSKHRWLHPAPRIPEPVGLGWGLRACNSHEFPKMKMLLAQGPSLENHSYLQMPHSEKILSKLPWSLGGGVVGCSCSKHRQVQFLLIRRDSEISGKK